jgi:hypothetical protein
MITILTCWTPSVDETVDIINNISRGHNKEYFLICLEKMGPEIEKLLLIIHRPSKNSLGMLDLGFSKTYIRDLVSPKFPRVLDPPGKILKGPRQIWRVPK